MIDDGIRRLIHTPAELSSEFVAWAEHNQSDPGIRFGLPSIDKRVIPMRAGELISFIARPGHGKTSILAYFARSVGKRIMDDPEDNRIVVYVTWEQSSEELTMSFLATDTYSVSDVAWGRVDLDIIRAEAIKGVHLPVWVIGHGIGRAGEIAVPRMTADVVLRAIETMEQDHGCRPALMLFDYLQLIPVPHARDRIQQVTEIPILIKELALRVGVPAVVGVQARREVDDREEKLPELRDAQWASSIEQTSDKVFSLWRPILTETDGAAQYVELGERRIRVTENLLLMRMLKQRGDAGRYTWPLYFAPQFVKLADMAFTSAGQEIPF